MPHADEWTRVKRQLLFPGSSSHIKKERESDQGGSHRQPQDHYSAAADIATLENTLVHRQDDGVAVPSVSKTHPDKTASAERFPETPAERIVASQENARSALRSLRPEILRQAGARPTWRIGRVTAVLDRTGAADSFNRHQRGARAVKKSMAEPLIEVKDSQELVGEQGGGGNSPRLARNPWSERRNWDSGVPIRIYRMTLPQTACDCGCSVFGRCFLREFAPRSL